MIVNFSNRFEKQFDAIKEEKLRVQIKRAVKSVIRAKSPQKIPSINKLKNGDKAYRIRVGDFRIGLIINAEDVFFMDIDHRKDFYRHFP